MNGKLSFLFYNFRLENFHYEVQLGMLRRSSFSPLEQTRVVDTVFVHKNFDPSSLDNDIAILRVSVPFELNQWATSACLPTTTLFPAVGTNCTVVGWGDTQENGPDCKSELTYLFRY